MCKVYNPVGSLRVIKQYLHQRNIYDFNSLKELVVFKENYSTYRENIISDHKLLIEKERDALFLEILDLDVSIKSAREECKYKLNQHFEKLQQQLNSIPSSTNSLQKLIIFFKRKYQQRKIKQFLRSFDTKVATAIQTVEDIQNEKKNRYQYILSNFNSIVNVSISGPISELERRRQAIEELNSSIYGAYGEHKVVKELEHLPDDYYLINDFSLSFNNAIYNHADKDYIKSIQIDHIIVGPSGIFLIETKNWSEKSLDNRSLRSPVQQIRRTSYILYKLFSTGLGNYKLELRKHHWGDKKVPIKNLIVFVSSKPKEQFQYVKILTVSELVNYIQYFDPILSFSETERISNFLLNLSSRKTISIK